MADHRFPRPVSVSAAGYILLFFGFYWLISGAFGANDFNEGAPPVILWTVALLTPYLGVAAVCCFRGFSFIRYVHWAVTLGVLACATVFFKEIRIFGVIKVAATLAVLIVTSILLAQTNAHWFFTKRDFRRRPGYKASFDRVKHPGDREQKKRFEY
jgi:hypothetical protein